jgi:7-carboxy-7-deazaguanine synthase
VDDRVSVILDVKTPGSGEVDKNLWSNITLLKPKDEVKFVLCDQADYVWAKQVLVEHGIVAKCPVLFSPVYEQLPPRDLAEWILADRLQVRMQIQLHKVLWGEVAGK